MKRRDLFKLLGLLAIPNIAKAKQELYVFGESSTETDSPHVFCNTPERATKYITSLYRKSHMMRDFEYVRQNSFKLAPPKPTPTGNYAISGKGKTKDEAWSRFWMDFDSQLNLTAPGGRDIYWRRAVTEEQDVLLDYMEVGYFVGCRFSTV